MKIKVPPKLVEWLALPLARAVASTWRVEHVNRQAWDDLVASGQGFACMLWHETLLPLLWDHRAEKAVIVVSHARDGQYLSDFAVSIGYAGRAGPGRAPKFRPVQGSSAGPALSTGDNAQKS